MSSKLVSCYLVWELENAYENTTEDGDGIILLNTAMINIERITNGKVYFIIIYLINVTQL